MLRNIHFTHRVYSICREGTEAFTPGTPHRSPLPHLPLKPQTPVASPHRPSHSLSLRLRSVSAFQSLPGRALELPLLGCLEDFSVVVFRQLVDLMYVLVPRS